jgi:AAA family ATP:ADP antiporter
VVRRLGIEPGEGRLFFWGAAALALAGWADVSVKNASETLFLKRVGVDYLPIAYLLNSILLVGTTYIMGRVAARSNRLRLLPRILFGLAVLLLPLWYLVGEDAKSAFVLLVLASKQFQSIALLAFWLAIGDLLDGRQAKRLFAPMMGGYTLGSLFGSLASDPIGRAIGIEALLPVAAVAFALSGLLTLPLERILPKGLDRGSSSGRKLESSLSRADSTDVSFRTLWSENQLFRLLFVGAAASGLLGPMLYFQFQYVADQAAVGEEGLLTLFSQIRVFINAGVLLIQVLVTANLFKRIGIPLSIVLSPVVYLIGFCGMSIRLNLAAGVGARTATTLQDGAIYDPAMRILFNLFPERERSRATALLEGPVKRAGGAIGNILSLAAVHFASAIAVGYVAIPIALGWLFTSLSLWRRYPALLLRASTRRARYGDELDISEMIDPNTVRVLSTHLAGPDPRPAIELVSEASPADAAKALAEAARAAPESTQSLLIDALNRVLERTVTESVSSPQASEDLEHLLVESIALSERDRADVVHAYGQLTPGDEAVSVLEFALADVSTAVRLAAAVALDRRGRPVDEFGNISEALEQAVASDDPVERRIALEELRARLLCSEPGPEWEHDLEGLSRLLDRETDRVGAAEAIAEIARRHGEAAVLAREKMLEYRDATDLRVRAAVLCFCGYAGIVDQAPWMIEQIAVDGGPHLGAVRNAAREGLIALGSEVADVLLVELSFGKRSTRDAILPILRQLRVEHATLRNLYERELDSVRRKLIHRHALSQELAAAIVLQRLREGVDEALHTALLLLAAIYDEDRIAELAERIKRGGGAGVNAMLLEALDASLGSHEKAELLPLMGDRPLEVRARFAAASLGIPLPDVRQATLALFEESDGLTRMLVAETLLESTEAADRLASSKDVEDHRKVLNPVEIALHLKSLPLFEGLTARQLMNLANEVREEQHAAGTLVFQEGEPGDCLYLIVEGQVRVTRGETLLREQGPKSFFGEIAVLEGENRTATITTTTSVRFLRLDRCDLLRLMEELPAIAIGICQTLSRRITELTGRVQA